MRVNTERGVTSEALIVIRLHREIHRSPQQPDQRVPTAASRSSRFRPRRPGVSGSMLCCRGSPAGPAGTGKGFIERLLPNGPGIGGASSETLADENLVGRGKGDQRCMRRADLHAGA